MIYELRTDQPENEALVVRIWLWSEGLPKRRDESGARVEPAVRLAPWESVDILIPPEFPFRAPLPRVVHYGFAGLPHVQWGRVLCLYASPNDWEPADGMAGFIERLVDFYGQIAEGTQDGDLHAWNRPVVYPDAAAGCLVVKKDLPSAARATGNPFYQWAIGIPVGPDRIDIIDWLPSRVGFSSGDGVDAWLVEQLKQIKKVHPTAQLITTVVIPRPISFEYPGFVSDLLNVLQGFDLFILTLLQALEGTAQVNGPTNDELGRPKPQESILLIRAPGDRRYSSTDIPAYFAAWRLTVTETEAMRNVVVGDDEAKKLAFTTLYETKTRWEKVYDARPEAGTRRDRDRPVTWLAGRRVLVLGCGALGAPIAEHCVRAGVAELRLVDNGDVSPGLLVRQPYEDADIGKAKAPVLAARLGRLQPEARVTASADDILLSDLFEDGMAQRFDLVIDATANRAVAEQIERAHWRSASGWPSLITVAIGQTATQGLAAISPAGSVGAGVDLLRRLALTARESSGPLTDVFHEFFLPRKERPLFQPDPGCSSFTFVGSTTEVTTLAAQLLDSAVAVLHSAESPQRSVGIVRLGRDAGPSDAGPSDTGPSPARTRLTYPADSVLEDQAGTEQAGADPELDRYQVRITPEAMEQMRRQVSALAAAGGAGTENETGGMLLGQFDAAARIVWVSEVTALPEGSASTAMTLMVNAAPERTALLRLSSQTGGLVNFIGFWHTHPDGRPKPSPTDRNEVARLMRDEGQLRLLMLVLGLPSEVWPPRIHAEVFGA